MLKDFTIHDYYCESGEGGRTSEYNSWQDFKKQEMDYEFSYNLLFRYDLVHGLDEEGEETPEMVLQLHHALQRHGLEQWHAIIHNITKEDLADINSHLQRAWTYLSQLWQEINNS